MWLPAILQRHSARRPDAIALRDVRRDVSWRAFERDVSALAHAIRQQVPPGGRVVVLSGNRVEVLETYFGCAAAGVIAAPINPALTDTEIAYILDRLEPDLFIAEPAGRARLHESRPNVPLWSIEEIKELPDAYSPQPAPQPAPQLPITAPAAILQTSATTGRPKGVVVDQRSFQLNALSWLADVGADERTTFLNACPLFHGSMVIALDYLAAGATVCVLDRFTPLHCLTALQRWQVGHAFLVPSMIRLLLESAALDDTAVSALRLLLHGAAPMPPEVAQAAEARLGVPLQTIYGITEGGGPTISLRPDDKPDAPPISGATCLGRPMLGTVARVVRGDGHCAAPGEVGEIRLLGDGVMLGYWRDPDATAQVLCDGELNTGDLGCIDDHGFIWGVDRRTDLILRGGQNVYPAEIEHVLRKSAQLADVAVVPAASPAWGQTPVAFVQPAAPDEPLDEAELLDLCVTHLAAYKRPSRFIAINEIPRNPAGKILRMALRERVADL